MEIKSKVAVLIEQRIKTLGKPQIEISKETGLQKPNIITMFKQGKTKIPLAKSGALAKALEMDALHLMKLCLEEYQPETWEVIKPYMDQVLTSDELKIVTALRSMSGQVSISALNDVQSKLLNDFIASLKI